MQKKTLYFIGIFFIFGSGFFVHNLYEWFPSVLTIIISPVCESIAEHMKMILTSYVLWWILKKILLKIFKQEQPNFLFIEFITYLFNTLLFLLIYLPIYHYLGENLVITLIIYFITICISQILPQLPQQKKRSIPLNVLSLISIIFLYAVGTYFSYHPPICDFFLDPTNNSYGLNK